MVRQIKEKQIDESAASLEALRQSRTTTEARLSHYTQLLETGLIAKESEHLNRLESAFT